MNRFILFGTALALLGSALPSEAAKHGGGGGRGGGGNRGGGGGGRTPPAAVHVQRAAPQARARVQAPRSQPFRNASPVVRQNRTIVNSNRGRTIRKSPTIAFGGTRNVQRNNTNIQKFRNTENRVNITRNNFRNRRDWNPPESVHRHWDHHRTYTWNHHRYHWYNNSWVLLDAGLYGGYPYYYDYGYDYTPGYYEPATTLGPEYAIGDNTVIDVQQELARRGYSPGAIDGVMGPQTRDAIIAFQRDNGMALTGQLDQNLLDELGV